MLATDQFIKKIEKNRNDTIHQINLNIQKIDQRIKYLQLFLTKNDIKKLHSTKLFLMQKKRKLQWRMDL